MKYSVLDSHGESVAQFKFLSDARLFAMRESEGGAIHTIKNIRPRYNYVNEQWQFAACVSAQQYGDYVSEG